MKKLVVLSLVFISNMLFSQQKVITYKVLDSATKEPLVFANVIFINKKTGTSTDEEGSFSFLLNEAKNESVKVSYIGYQTKTVSLLQGTHTTIYLTKKSIGLNEVTVYALKDKKHKTINSFINKEYVGLGNFSGGQYPSTIARWYDKPSKFENQCFLNEIRISFLDNDEEKDIPAKFRLRILSVNKDGLPDDDLVYNNITLQRAVGKESLVVNLLPYKIEIPENGFYIAVEHLFIKENEFTEKRNVIVNDTVVYPNYKLVKYAPIFKGVLEEKYKNIKCYYLSLNGWKKMNTLDTSNKVFKNKILAPAFVVKFSD
ncbi:carboxypeptidase-like regulatory domain-containing protein [Zhouia sp. PK063]|uniref:carboxypeptidase-like regulatory domain-containing protein n=1 Tax=Zhouia sp. PK063 TaxID=3373602 RepID=UPI0037966579